MFRCNAAVLDHMRSVCLALAAALVCPSGASAADASRAPVLDRPAAAGVTAWSAAGGAAVRAQESPFQVVSRKADAPGNFGWSDQVYRYGEHPPDLEELPMTGRAPFIGSDSR